MAALSWHRFRTSAPRTLTYHWAETEDGTYDIRRIGNDGYTVVFFDKTGGDKFYGAYRTLKEAKRECGYHNNSLTQKEQS